MIDHRDDTGINYFLTREERDKYRNMILSVYPSYGRFGRRLYHMRDKQLMAFANNLVKRGLVSNNPPSVTTRFLKQFIGADSYILNESDGRYEVVFGHGPEGNKFQVGRVLANEDMIIESCDLGDHKYTRFLGMKIIIL